MDLSKVSNALIQRLPNKIDSTDSISCIWKNFINNYEFSEGNNSNVCHEVTERVF